MPGPPPVCYRWRAASPAVSWPRCRTWWCRSPIGRQARPCVRHNPASTKQRAAPPKSTGAGWGRSPASALRRTPYYRESRRRERGMPPGSTPPRPLTVVQVLPALDMGGVERGTLEVARRLVAEGHRSIVISAGGRLVSQLIAEGSSHFAWDVGAKRLATLRWIPKLRRLLREQRPDVLHLRSRLPAWMAYLAWKSLPSAERPALVPTVHGFYSPGRYSGVMARGERIIAISDSVRTYTLRHYPWVRRDRIRVIHRGVDPTVYPYGYTPPAEWLVGWTHPRKRHYEAELRAKIAAAGLGGAITLLGHRSDLREIMAVSHAVLSLSTEPEAFGRGSREALSLGRPVLGYAHGGGGEQLAAIFPAGAVALRDRGEVVARLTEWYRAPPCVPDRHEFTLERMLSATLEVYREAAAAHPKKGARRI